LSGSISTFSQMQAIWTSGFEAAAAIMPSLASAQTGSCAWWQNTGPRRLRADFGCQDLGWHVPLLPGHFGRQGPWYRGDAHFPNK
jgi:hypothetical protein